MKLYLEARNLHRYIILNQKFDCGIYFCQTTFFGTFFGHWKGQVLVKKRSKTAHLSKNTPRSCKFTQRDNFSWDIWYYHSFRTNYNFWLSLGHPEAQNGDEKLTTLLNPPNKNIKFAQTDGYLFMKNLMLLLIYYMLQFPTTFGEP